MGQKITYDDLFKELQELKSFYYLNKKNWIEMFTGKLSGMIAGGMISETISKEIVEVIKEYYPDLIKQTPTTLSRISKTSPSKKNI